MSSIADEIIKLQQLKEIGAITQDEFNTLKCRILSNETYDATINHQKIASIRSITNVESLEVDPTVVVNGTELNSKDIIARLMAGRKSDVIRYIMGKTKCTVEEANDTIKIIQKSSSNPQCDSSISKTKNNESQRMKQTYDTSYTTEKVIRCPNCGSTNVKKISLTKRFFSTELFGLASSSIGKQFQCMEKNCGYKW